MELCTMLLQSCCSIPFTFLTPKANTTRDFAPIRVSCLNFSTKGHNFSVNQVGQLQSSITTVVANERSVMLDDCINEEFSCTRFSGSYVYDDPGGTGEKWNDNDGTLCLDDHRMFRVCDKLINVFMVDAPNPTDWIRLLAVSKEWKNIKLHFFRHCQGRVDSVNHPVMKQKLVQLQRKLKEIDEDVQTHNKLLEVISRTPSEISETVSRCRKDFTKEFFVHLYAVAESYCGKHKEQNDLVKLGNTCLAAVQAYDAASGSIEAMDSAELKSQDITSSPYLDASCRKMDTGAEGNECFDPVLAACWLQSCYNVEEVGSVHAVVLKHFKDSVTYVDNNLICSYLRLGKLARAHKVFNGMSRRNTVTWTAMINGYLNFNLDDEALKLFHDSIRNGVQANSKMFVCVMNLCGKRVDLELGRQIHACILKGNWRNLIVDSAVISFYAKCGEMSSAFRTFDRMAERDVVCWTTMITACSQQGFEHKAFQLLSQMIRDEFFPNEYTVSGALKACGEKKALGLGRQLHGAIIKKICKSDVFIGTSLVNMYAKCGEIVDSRQVFDTMRIRNTATWTSIISGYARNGLGEEAINIFRLMKRKRKYVNKLTFVSVLLACGSIEGLVIGREVHAQIIKNIIHTNMYIGSTLVWFYCKCKEYSQAFKVLHHMPFRDVVSWTAIISGCAQHGHESEALEFLNEMMEEGVMPNSFTYSSALKACAKLEAISQGKLIHSYASKTSAMSNVFVASTLIYMYAKLGYVSEAFQVFDNMPERNWVSWRAMILGYARNGRSRDALKLMYEMQAEGFVVDDYILSTVLTACGDAE